MGFFVTLFIVLMVYMGYSVIKNGAAWYATPYNPRIANARQNINGGTIYDRNGVALAWSEGTTGNTTKINLSAEPVPMW